MKQQEVFSKLAVLHELTQNYFILVYLQEQLHIKKHYVSMPSVFREVVYSRKNYRSS